MVLVFNQKEARRRTFAATVARFMKREFRRNLAIIGAFLLLARAAGAANVDLQEAFVVHPQNLAGPAQKAITVLVEEVEKRTGIRWSAGTSAPSTARALVAVCTRDLLKEFEDANAISPGAVSANGEAEGYRLCVRRREQAATVLVVGNDERGVMFGVGRLLRALHMTRGRVSLDDGLDVVARPHYRLRGHQLGYRPKTNSYDAWDLPRWEQYIRDLAVFGCNAIELIPPHSDDAATSPHFPRPPLEMMAGMSRLANDYGMDVWVWYPAMDSDYSDAATVRSALAEWAEVLRQLPRLDAVFVPGGDPGHTQPRQLINLLEKQTANLRHYHPGVQMWVSPQGFTKEWLDEFVEILEREQPAWLAGVVFGPQVRVSLPELRKLIPAKYPIRHYPDITHSRQCQYPVPDWDAAFAVTEGRECINPRPEGQALIFRNTQQSTTGFITYSEGCNDDVNKIIWSALGWEPQTPVIEILRQYARYFVGEQYTDTFAQGLLALERNWQGPVLPNCSVETTLAQFREIERSASPADLKNWRLQQALFRAYYDAHVRRRLLHEAEAEARAIDALRRAGTGTVSDAVSAALDVLERTATESGAEDLRKRVCDLGDALFETIGMQLSVKRHKAIAVDRGASLDTLDYPLNNGPWLRNELIRIKALRPETDQLAAINAILDWTNPGPGGFYDDLGNSHCQPHLVRGPGVAEDPGCYQSARVGFAETRVACSNAQYTPHVQRRSWLDHAESLYDTPLEMHYTGLDPEASYKVRVVYAGDSQRRRIRLTANGQIEIHPLMTKPFPVAPVEFSVPAAATRTGALTLRWYGEAGIGGNGRGCQVSEVWLIRALPQAVPSR